MEIKIGPVTDPMTAIYILKTDHYTMEIEIGSVIDCITVIYGKDQRLH